MFSLSMFCLFRVFAFLCFVVLCLVIDSPEGAILFQYLPEKKLKQEEFEKKSKL